MRVRIAVWKNGKKNVRCGETDEATNILMGSFPECIGSSTECGNAAELVFMGCVVQSGRIARGVRITGMRI